MAPLTTYDSHKAAKISLARTDNANFSSWHRWVAGWQLGWLLYRLTMVDQHW